ncbi:MAG: PQQ-binding-like beta-propeller repeat protein [Candidatus Nomurabacteria bacterium]|nr:PQQ-binding-like beta-propeller repeat protein [Candidatus Nomurabacteria bacterium]
MNNPSLEILKKVIISEVFISKNEQNIVTEEGENESWLFDFRRVMLRPDILDAYANLFLETYKDKYPFQVCGLEVAAIPLLSAIVMKSKQLGMPINGFFIRKSRKKSGLLKIVEGEINKEPIILVDDIINSGSTFIRQVEVLEELTKEETMNVRILAVSSIIRFRNENSYKFFYEKGIKVDSFFALTDFVRELPELLIKNKKEIIPQNNFAIGWSFKGKNSNFWYVKPKTDPLFEDGRVYLGTDSGIFYCFNGKTGEIIFDYRIFALDKKKKTFSTPVIAKENIVFGSHDGNIYALNKITGKRKWVFMEGDYVDSPVSYISRHDFVVTGLSLGLFKKKMALVAISSTNGDKVWEFIFEKSVKVFFVYSEKRDLVLVETDDGKICAISGKDGTLVWKRDLEVICTTNPCIDEEKGIVIFSGFTNKDNEDEKSELFICNIKTGDIISKCFGIGFQIFGTPVIYTDTVIVTSLDKHIRAFYLNNGEIKWNLNLGSRIFSTPVTCFFKTLQKPFLYIGTNNGHLFEINPDEGIITGKTIVSERITDGIVFDGKTETVFLATHANDLYSLKRKA